MTQELTRKLGVPGSVFVVIAAAAPNTVVAANFPTIFGVPSFVGASLMMLVATATLLFFSVGCA
ncbi:MULTISPECIES: hypothetical protein [unclassified Pseudoclavibacter]|uniref:hypothetical protein n=1 Tax=unclassified Pseudoclavibacter TaxID=2615177 RepID=UPI001BA95D2F|nr:hypothetical protein [Pseudoclavibacter sp. Marseille-Q4354]MBS3179904.1 hypothetical protein [Pseudoclavibacter sp. Marseille-Q4354]